MCESERARESEIGKSGTREGRVAVSTAKVLKRDGANAIECPELGDTAPHPIRNRVHSSRMLVRVLAILPCHRQSPIVNFNVIEPNVLEPTEVRTNLFGSISHTVWILDIRGV